MLAAWTHAAELALNEEESKNLGDAIARVQALYDVSVFSEETAAWMNLVIVCGTIYGPRFIALRVRQKKEASPKPVIVDIDSGDRMVTGAAN